MLSEHPLYELTKPGDDEALRFRRLSPGDIVQHVDDHKSMGTIVAQPTHSERGTANVLWSASPNLSPTSIAGAKIQRYVQQALGRYNVGQPINSQTTAQLQQVVASILVTLHQQNVISNWHVDLPKPLDSGTREMMLKIWFNLRPGTTTHHLDVIFSA